jgi:hypothetical protein
MEAGRSSRPLRSNKRGGGKPARLAAVMTRSRRVRYSSLLPNTLGAGSWFPGLEGRPGDGIGVIGCAEKDVGSGGLKVKRKALFDRFADVVDPPANECKLGVVFGVNGPRPGERSFSATGVALC